MPFPPPTWTPPSSQLVFQGELWTCSGVSSVSYPSEGNEACFQVEDTSYWFAHRQDCIQALVHHFAPAGTFYDIGGGNGYNSQHLQSGGRTVVLVEPGPGARNALSRGVVHVIQSTLQDAQLRRGSADAVGAFDVLEHIQDDLAFLREIANLLAPGGYFFGTVPASKALWSDEDRQAGHFRRYTSSSLQSVLAAAGFETVFVSYLFSWLVLPHFLLRTLPSFFRSAFVRGSKAPVNLRNDHSLPGWIASFVRRIHRFERHSLDQRRAISFGTSLIVVARRARPGS